MSRFAHPLGRRYIFFSDHALDRWWTRCRELDSSCGRQEAMDRLRDALRDATWLGRDVPSWTRLTWYHRARVEGAIVLDANRCFITNRNASGDVVAVTYLERDTTDNRGVMPPGHRQVGGVDPTM